MPFARQYISHKFMQRTIQQITQQLVDQLPENDQYYRLDELRSWDFPSFVIRRIKIELERNLAESMIIPKTDWANTQSDAVLDAWQKFVDAIQAEARLPASYGKTVIETAVADVIEMLVQPRKNVPHVIFGTDEELTAEEIRERLKAVVVYPHFSRLIPRYMQKKELDTLTKKRCAAIISNADKKLTENYSPLNWAQMLEPLFKLVGGNIDTNLLRLFFEDKDMPRIARKLDLMNDTLSRAHLIEVLSSPDLLDFEGYEDEQSSLFGNQPETLSDQPKQASHIPEPTKKPESNKDSSDEETNVDEAFGIAEEKESKEVESTEETEADETLNKNFTEPEEEFSDKKIEEDEDSLNAVFREQDEEVIAGEATDSDQEKVIEENAAEDPEEEKPQEIDLKADKENDQESVEETDQPVEQSSSQNGQSSQDDEETPIWMRYMSDEEVEEYEKEQAAEKEAEESGFIEEPIIDLTKEDASDEEVKALKKQLKVDREFFVEEIFRGSDRAFEEAVEEIASHDSWRDVSKYIEKDIFKRNLVDMYSEAALDFTDQLQTYFSGKTNQNK